MGVHCTTWVYFEGQSHFKVFFYKFFDDMGDPLKMNTGSIYKWMVRLPGGGKMDLGESLFQQRPQFFL